MKLLRRTESLLLSPAYANFAGNLSAAHSGGVTTGTSDRSQAPPGTFREKDGDYLDSLLIAALRAAEKLLGLSWDDKEGQHVAAKRKPFDQKDWENTILEKYEGQPAKIAAAEEDVPEHTIRDLRKKHGRDTRGKVVD